MLFRSAIPSMPPAPTEDPSFAPTVAPHFTPRAAPRPSPPASWYEAPLARTLGGIGWLLDAISTSRLGRWRVPITVVLTLALVGLFYEIGVGVRWVRRLVRLWAALQG